MQSDLIFYISDPEWSFHPSLLELHRLRREMRWRSELIFTAESMCVDIHQIAQIGIRAAAVVIVIVGKRGMPEWLEPDGVVDPVEQALQAHKWLTALNKPCWILRLSDHYLQQCDLPGRDANVYAEFWTHFLKLCPEVCDIHDSDQLAEVIGDICDGRAPKKTSFPSPEVITGAVDFPPPPPAIIIVGSTDSGVEPSSHVLEQPADPITMSAGENHALDNNVQFTIFQPEVITPKQWCDFLAYAHLSAKRPDAPEHEPDPKKEVERRARAALGAAYDEYDRLRQNSSVAFPKDGEITFAPDMDGAEFNPRSVTFFWGESVHEARFRVRAKVSAPKGQQLRGRMNVYLGPLLVASVDLAMDVNTKGVGFGMLPTVPASAEIYRTIFASYSHHDTEVVHTCQAYASLLGDRLIRDQDFLRGGQDWRTEIRSAIERADVFQLFWSPNSAASSEVRWEVECALAMPKRNFVRPTYWHTPMPSPWSNQPNISNLHFEWMPFRQAQPAYSNESPSALSDSLKFDDNSNKEIVIDSSPQLSAPSEQRAQSQMPCGDNINILPIPAYYSTPCKSTVQEHSVKSESPTRAINVVAFGMIILAVVYCMGIIISPDHNVAGISDYNRLETDPIIIEMRKIAELGNAEAQYRLGVHYSNEGGEGKDSIEAYKWVLLAGGQGNDKAKKLIPIFEELLSPEKRAEGQRLAKEWQAAFEKRQGEE